MTERGVLDLQQQTPVGHDIGQHTLNAWYPPTQDAEDIIQSFWMLFGQVLNDVGEIVARFAQPFLGSCLGLPARAVGRQVGHVSAGDKVAQRYHAWVLGELPQRVDRQQVGGFEGNIHPPFLVVGHIATNRSALAVCVFQKRKRNFLKT